MKRLIIGFGLTLALLTMLGALDVAQAAGLGSPIPPKGQQPPPPGPDENTPVWRVQINLTVCDLPNAGTDNKILVAMNEINYTVLDRPIDDFERGSTQMYDLLLNGVLKLADIKYLKIYKGGSDGVCLTGFTLLVNEREIYARTISPSQWWLDSEYYGYDSRTLMTLGSTLRGYSGWQAWTAPSRPHLLPATEIGSRLMTAVGTGMYDFNVTSQHSLSWLGSNCDFGPRCVYVLDDKTIQVRLDIYFKCIDSLLGDGGCADVTVTYDADLRFSCVSGMIGVTKVHDGGETSSNGNFVTAAGEVSAVREYVGSRLTHAFQNIKFPACSPILVYPVDNVVGIGAEALL